MCSFHCVAHMPAVFLKATLAFLLIIATDRKVISGELLSVRDKTSSLSSLKEVLGRSSRQVLNLCFLELILVQITFSQLKTDRVKNSNIFLRRYLVKKDIRRGNIKQ